MNLPINEIVCGSALEILKTFPAESINCCISSPPYWALRDYGIDGQLGLEPTFQEYIAKLCDIYDEVFRVLCKVGTCWVNLGDVFGGSQAGRGTEHLSEKQASNKGTRWMVGRQVSHYGVPAKSLCLIPQRFAIEMVNRGWILRNVIIWSKPNPMPSSAKDRFTVDFEYVFFFVKSKSYFFEPQYEPYLTESNAERPRMGQGANTKYKQKRNYGGGASSFLGHSGTLKADGTQIQHNPLGRNKRTTWVIPTEAYPEAHFATFPRKLVEPMILTGCPKDVCVKCGKGRRKIYEPSEEYAKYLGKRMMGYDYEKDLTEGCSRKREGFKSVSAERYFKGYRDCGCGKGWRPGIVLDMFCRLGDDLCGRCAA